MKQIITSAARHPWLVVIGLMTVTLAAISQLASLSIEITAEGLMVNQPEALAEHRASLETFGSDAITVIFIEDEDLFHPDNLTAIRQTLREIDALPQVTRTTSLFSMRYLRSKDGYIYTDPYLKTIPNSSDSAQRITDAALLNPLIERNLLSSDGTVMAINLYLNLSDYQRGQDEELAAVLDSKSASLQNRFRHVFHLGDPSIRSAISQQIRHDLGLILPFSVALLTLTLWLILKRSFVALVPLLTAGLSVIWTLGAMAMLSIPIHVLTSIIPALLIIIGSTEDIHLISEYQAGMQRGMSNLLSTHFMANHMGTAVLLTFVTTCLGFLSITLCKIELLQQFGLMTAIGLGLNFIITVTLIPASMKLVSHYGSRQPDTGERFCSLVESIFNWVQRNPRSIGTSIILLMSIATYWALQIEVNNNVMTYFPTTSKLPAQATRLHDKLSGIQSLTILVSGKDEAFLKARNLQQLKMLQAHLEASGHFDKSFSFADFIGVIHSGINEESPNRTELPQSDEIVSGYLSLLGHNNASSFVSEDYNQARIIVRHDITSSRQLNLAVRSLMNFSAENLDPSLAISVTGSSYLNSQAADYMADGQLRTLLTMLAIIFLVVSLQLSNPKLGLVAVASNLFPVTMLLGVMGLFDIPLDTSTVMVAAITLGICVDHSMHFMLRFQRLRQSGRSLSDTLMLTVRQESLPIITTSIALILGFGTLALSAFPPVSRFGLLSAMVMLLALISTFIVTPLIMQLSEGRVLRPSSRQLASHHAIAKLDAGN